MKEFLRYMKYFVFSRKRFDSKVLSNYLLVFQESEYKKTRYAGYLNWVGDDALVSTSSWQHGYFEIMTSSHVKLQCKEIPALKIVLSENDKFYLQSPFELEPVKLNHHFNKSIKSHKFGLLWCDDLIELYVDDYLVYKTSNIDDVKLFIKKMRIITQGKTDYVKVWKKV